MRMFAVGDLQAETDRATREPGGGGEREEQGTLFYKDCSFGSDLSNK